MLLLEVGERVLFSEAGKKLINAFTVRMQALVLSIMLLVNLAPSAVRLIVALALVLGNRCSEQLVAYLPANRNALSAADYDFIDREVRVYYELSPPGLITWLLQEPDCIHK